MQYLIHVLFSIAITLSCFAGISQHTITGTFPSLAHQQVRLFGFEGFDRHLIDETTVGADGNFILTYPLKHKGMGYLEAAAGQPFIVVLGAENLKLQGEFFSDPSSIRILDGFENKIFEQYASEHPRREQALSAWIYLQRIYQNDPLFAVQEQPGNAITAELQRIRQEDRKFLENLDPKLYVSWFLPLRRLVSAVSVIAQQRTDEIPDAIAAFRALDYTDPRLYKSGLLRETIEAHFWLIENSGRSLDSVFVEMNISIDYMVSSLAADERKLNTITDHLFNLLEQRSLFGASEHLALKLLNEFSCTVDDRLAGQLESYRAMKIGNTAPDIVFTGDVFRNGQPISAPASLSEIDARFVVVVFGSAWCPMCSQELLAIRNSYEKWASNDVEVVYISLDEDKAEFISHSARFPFISFSDYKKWETPAVKDFHVFATPTMFLLDQNRKIILRPNSVRQMDAWVDWNLVKSNR